MTRITALLLAAWLVQAPAAATWLAGPAADLAPGGCTVVYATDGQQMLGGNNEDYINPLTRVWFIPPEDGAFGRAYFGFEDQFAQGGMNDQGLFFDGLALDRAYPVTREGKEYYAGNLAERAMAECATVDCAVDLFDRYYAVEAWSWQFFFGDARGASAIVEADATIRQQGGYQVATNFAQSITPPEESRDRRYGTAVGMLEGMETLSVESIRDVMDAVHVSGPSQTLYTTVYDLANQVVYIYYFHTYDDVVVLDLQEELARGYHSHDLASLFAPNEAAEAWAAPRLRRYQALIDGRRAEGLDPAILQAYSGTYRWPGEDRLLTVDAGEQSLVLHFADYRRYELFPSSVTDFFWVGFLGSEFAVGYEAGFVLDEDRRIEYLEMHYGAGPVRLERLGPDSVLPELPTATPTATATKPPPTAPPSPTPPPTATPLPTATSSPTTPPTDTPALTGVPAQATGAAPTATPTPATANGGDGLPWLWSLLALALVGAGAGWLTVRRRRPRGGTR